MDNRFDNYRAKIFMTGDSITEGDGNASAYRYQLFKRLYEAGAAFEFLGPNTSGDLRLPKAYYHHGGYCGITVGTDPEKDPGLMKKLTAQPGYAEAVRDADIVILWIGYNDYGRKIDLEHITDRVTTLIGKYHELNPDMVIYVGTLFNYAVERDINAWILDPSTKTDLEARFVGLEYHGVDMNLGKNRLSKVDNDFPEDDGHPAEAGNIKIAASWFEAIIDRVREFNSRPAEEDAVKPIRAAALTGDVRDISLRQGSAVTFEAKVMPLDAEVGTVVWSSSNTTVAVVDDYGRVSARIPGEAVITARALDGGHELRSKVTVYGGPLDLARGYMTVYTSDFTTTDNWNGPEDVLSAQYNKLAIRYNKTITGELVSKIPVECVGDFVMSFVYRSANDRTHGDERYVSLLVGRLEMRITADSGHIMLFSDGILCGERKLMGPVAINMPYAVKREGKIVTLYRDGEVLFACAFEEAEPLKGLKLKWNNMPKSDIRDIRISVR